MCRARIWLPVDTTDAYAYDKSDFCCCTWLPVWLESDNDYLIKRSLTPNAKVNYTYLISQNEPNHIKEHVELGLALKL